jgi:hypothetical protein
LQRSRWNALRGKTLNVRPERTINHKTEADIEKIMNYAVKVPVAMW